ncbi:peptidoglycan DD-metalloendopeptidase family protein, partial [Patescibacteria group bacterium]|nr:peptidoglycan DD-metalloendopeptidase family protein [Patescibacteria group bacterium]
KILVNVLIFLIKSFLLLIKYAIVFLIKVILRPIFIIIQFFFYKVVVKIYRCYITVIKQLGWLEIRKKVFLFLFHKKLAHLVIVAIILITVSINLINKTKAKTTKETKISNAIITHLVKSEFMKIQDETELIEEFADKEFSLAQQPNLYLDDLSAIKYQARAVMGSLEELKKQESMMFEDHKDGAIIKPDIITTKKVKKIRTEIVEYIVKAGDSVSTIADEFEVTVNTILWENNLSAYSIIRPGDKLVILPISGIVHIVKRGETLNAIAKKYIADKEKIIQANKLGEDANLTIAQKLIIPGGTKAEYTAPIVEKYSGFQVIKKTITQPKIVSGNKMIWPTQGYRITQYYSWRHFAVDIANKIGTPIYATDTGVIQYVGWSIGYGYNIIIDHGGSKKTRYAHLSKFYVKTGQKVGKGESIGAMGSTGWSTGPHLHFEVIINGRKHNPLNYIR